MVTFIGAVDEPVAAGSTDYLDITIHSRALISFIKQTNTPMTVGIQGEWGSGKTSLLNSIRHAFTNDNSVKQIWINSWEYSLLSSPEEALLKIINRVLSDLIETDNNTALATSIKNGTRAIFRGALRAGAHVAFGKDAAEFTEELMEPSEQGIGILRSNLKKLVYELSQRKANPITKIIVYVDDLDRIEPKSAVATLELLKNIFNVPNCVFILAIDYQVVVKGLEHKFGKRSPENDWEFRAFFDKIIQLPFMMPMGQYNIAKYVNSLLLGTGYVDEKGLDVEDIREIILRTIGGNPRSIKRLVNSISLIQIFSEEKIRSGNEEQLISGSFEDQDNDDESINNETDEEKILMFALLCLQIAFPSIYRLLLQEPNFQKWDEDFAYKQTERTEETMLANGTGAEEVFKRDFENAKRTADCDEPWENALFRICYINPQLKVRFGDISKFLNYIKNKIYRENPEAIGESIAKIIKQTTVTNVTSTAGDQNIRSALLKSNVRQAISFDEFISIKKLDDHYKNNIIKFINYLKSNDIDLEEKYTPSQISIRNINSRKRAKNVIYINANKSRIRVGFADQLNVEQEFLNQLKSSVNGNLSKYKNKDGLYFHLPHDISDSYLEKIMAGITKFKNKFT